MDDGFSVGVKIRESPRHISKLSRMRNEQSSSQSMGGDRTYDLGLRHMRMRLEVWEKLPIFDVVGDEVRHAQYVTFADERQDVDMSQLPPYITLSQKTLKRATNVTDGGRLAQPGEYSPVSGAS